MKPASLVSRHRIKSAGTKRMTSQQTLHAEEHPTKQTPLLDRLIHVDRTGRLETAGSREKRRNELLVELQEQKCRFPDPVAEGTLHAHYHQFSAGADPLRQSFCAADRNSARSSW